MTKPTIEQKWRQRIEEVKTEAGKLPHGKERDTLTKKARQLETASHIYEGLSSPGLQLRDEGRARRKATQERGSR